MKDLKELPKLRDSLSYLYLERAVLKQKGSSIEAISEDGVVAIPVASLSVLMLGPGISVTHAAVKALADNGCSVLWVGEDATRFYAYGTGETRKSHHLLRQARLSMDPERRLGVVMRMYQMRFDDPLDDGLTLEQIRGKEGARVRDVYARASRAFGVEWHGRRYDRGSWERSDPVNRALSAANALLNGLCHAAIVSGGYSPALGFIHTGKQLSFVYDVADLYKAEITIPAAFQVVSESPDKVESRVRVLCRERFRESKLLARILPDIDALLRDEQEPPLVVGDVDVDGALPGPWWEPKER